MKRYFSYDPDFGFELHETASAAQASAQNAIDLYREQACDGWPEEVDRVCWGEICQHTKEIDTSADTGQESCDFVLAAIAAQKGGE